MSQKDPMPAGPVSLLSLMLLLPAFGCESGDKPFEWEQWPMDNDGQEGHATIPRPEHPNPSFMRRDWTNLNGAWEFRFDPDLKGMNENWAGGAVKFDRTITVPFPWNSVLSGIGEDTGDNGGIGWYRKEFSVSSKRAGVRYFLVIGAADWDTILFVNGAKAAENHNGYLPMRADITELIAEGVNTLAFLVRDYGNDGEYPRGKQGSPWYTNVGGVWQTTYIEVAGAEGWISSIRLTPVPGEKAFSVSGRLDGEFKGCTVRAYARGHEKDPVFTHKADGSEFGGKMAVPWLDEWKPGNPVLQEFEFRLDCGGAYDAVRTYSGLRKVERRKISGLDYEAIHINDRPEFIRGVLVQGYNPDGLYTYPSEAALIGDLDAARRAGFNLVRLHIKVEEPRVLYNADRLGLLVDADVPNYGVFPVSADDTKRSRTRWQETMEGMIERDFNHPSIVWWTLFNEDWGFLSIGESYDKPKQTFVDSMVKRARELDPSRIVEDMSALRYDHIGDTDVNSFHLYDDDPAGFEKMIAEWVDNCSPGSAFNCVEGAAQNGAPLINTEYGPFSYEQAPERTRNRDISWGFRSLTSIFRRYDKVAGYIFTELYDVETELNGFLRYDRTPKEFGYAGGISPAGVNGADFLGFTEHPFHAGTGSADFVLTSFTSRWGSKPSPDEKIRVALVDARTDLGLAEKTVPVAAAAFRTTVAEPMTWSFAGLEPGPYYFHGLWLDPEANIIAANYLPFEVLGAKKPAPECGSNHCTVPLDLDDCTGTLDKYSTVVVDGEVMAAGFLGEGYMECQAILPADVPTGVILDMAFTGEMAANADGAPMTDGRGKSGTVEAVLNGTFLASIPLPPDQADSRGLLSCLNGTVPPCGYGEALTWGPVRSDRQPSGVVTGRFTASGEEANGFILYGRRMGRYGLQPSIYIAW